MDSECLHMPGKLDGMTSPTSPDPGACLAAGRAALSVTGEGQHRREMARHLRRNETEAERRLWQKLRSRQLGGYKFRRQFPIGPFFADFCCANKKFIVEVDGAQHFIEKDKDANRTAWLMKQGFRVIRFWNEDVMQNLEAVCEKILKEITNPHPNLRKDVMPFLSSNGEDGRRPGEVGERHDR
jgi:very-short-patch-repair endonuclease